MVLSQSKLGNEDVVSEPGPEYITGLHHIQKNANRGSIKTADGVVRYGKRRQRPPTLQEKYNLTNEDLQQVAAIPPLPKQNLVTDPPFGWKLGITHYNLGLDQKTVRMRQKREQKKQIEDEKRKKILKQGYIRLHQDAFYKQMYENYKQSLECGNVVWESLKSPQNNILNS